MEVYKKLFVIMANQGDQEKRMTAGKDHSKPRKMTADHGDQDRLRENKTDSRR